MPRVRVRRPRFSLGNAPTRGSWLVVGILAALVVQWMFSGVASAVTVNVPAETRDCAIRNGTSASTNYCSTTTLEVGGSGTNKRRTLISFPVTDYVPRNATIQSADVNLYLTARTTTNVIPVGVHELTRNWTSAATWNRYQTGSNWTAAGGDFKPTAESSNPAAGSPLPSWHYWPVPGLAQKWADESVPNYGLLLKQTTEGTPANFLTFASSTAADTTKRPYLQVTYVDNPPDTSPAGLVFLAAQHSTGPTELWRSDANGTNRRYLAKAIAPGGADMRDPALSPDGRNVAVAYGNRIGIVPVDGGAFRTVYDSVYQGTPTTGESYHPQWSPDGERIIFVGDVSASSIRGKLYTVRSDGSDLTQYVVSLPSGVTRMRDPSFSPSGRRIVFAAFNDQAKNGRVYTAALEESASGSFLVDLLHIYSDPAGASATTSLRDTAYSDDGSSVVFSRWGDPFQLQVHRMSKLGGGQLQLTNETRDPGSNDGATWSPDGSTIAWTNMSNGGQQLEVRRMDPDGTNASALLSGLYATFNPSFRQPADMSIVRADMFRPYLRFDESEHWRPLHIESFFAEGHTLCVELGVDCQPMTNAADLQRAPSVNGLLDVTGTGGEENYHSPYAECTDQADEDLRDCDVGPRSSIYWHQVGPSPGGYTYYDYWFFYRYNDAPDISASDHEGDWESVSVAPAPDDRTFDFVSFSNHGDFHSYLRDNLSCDLGATGSCGTEASKLGRHVSTFVASGTHANYAQPCSNSCFQHGGFPPETDHGGEEQWGNNYAPESLVELPAPAPRTLDESDEGLELAWTGGPRNWTDWPGLWTASDDVIRGPAGGNPNRAHFYSPWLNACVDGDDCAEDSGGARIAAQSRQQTTSSCETWFGSEVSLLACDPRRLDSSLSEMKLGRKGSISVRLGQDRWVADNAPGLAQLLSEPLRVGDSASIRGEGLEGVRVFVRVQDAAGRHYEAGLPIGSAGGGSASIRVLATSSSAARDAEPRVLLKQAEGTTTAEVRRLPSAAD